jgi:hypothetical protein
MLRGVGSSVAVGSGAAVGRTTVAVGGMGEAMARAVGTTVGVAAVRTPQPASSARATIAVADLKATVANRMIYSFV